MGGGRDGEKEREEGSAGELAFSIHSHKSGIRRVVMKLLWSASKAV